MSSNLLDEFLAVAEAAIDDEEPNPKTKVNTTGQDEDLIEKLLSFEDQIAGATQPSASVVHNGDTDSSDDESNRNYENNQYNEYGREIKQLLGDVPSGSGYEVRPTWKQKGPVQTKKVDPNLYTDPFFGIRISKPLISSSMLQERMQGRTAVSMQKIKEYVRTDNNAEDWVVAGVLVGKSPVKTSQKGTQYMIWTLSDLKADLKTIGLFLFGNAYKQLWKTSIGEVLGVLNPSVLEQKDGVKDQATLSVDNAQRVMLLGTAKDYGVCKSRRKDGEQCTSFVNTSSCEYCMYHIRQEYQKLSKRSELQSSFQGRGLTALRNKVLGKNEVFYAGKSYMAIPAKKSKKLIQRDTTLLRSLSQTSTNSIVNNINVNNINVKKGLAASLDTSRMQRIKDYELLRKLKAENKNNDRETSTTISKPPSSKNNFNDALNIDDAIKKAENALIGGNSGLNHVKSAEDKKIQCNDRKSMGNSSKGDTNVEVSTNGLKSFDFLNVTNPKRRTNNLNEIDIETDNDKDINTSGEVSKLSKVDITQTSGSNLYNEPTNGSNVKGESSSRRNLTSKSITGSNAFLKGTNVLNSTCELNKSLNKDNTTNSSNVVDKSINSMNITSKPTISSSVTNKSCDTNISDERTNHTNIIDSSTSGLAKSLEPPRNVLTKSLEPPRNVLDEPGVSSSTTYLTPEQYKNLIKNTKLVNSLKKDKIELSPDVSSPISKTSAIRMTKANLKALQYVKKHGPIKKVDENHPKKPGVKRFLETSDEPKKKPKLADASFTSERFKKIMALQSKHTNLLEEVDREKEEKYFKKLEIKEKMEEKMMTVFKVDCKAVKCLTCKYKSFSAGERCKEERHPLKVIDAVKRFFKCAKCGNRTVSLEIVPLSACNNCGGAKWERTTMMKERTEMVGEKLSIRGWEEKFIGSSRAGGNINLLVPDE